MIEDNNEQQKEIKNSLIQLFSCSLVHLVWRQSLGRPRIPRPIPETPKPSGQLDN